MNRRQFFKTVALAGTAALCRRSLAAGGTIFSNSILEARIGRRARPNVIFILADDLGWRDVSYDVGYGYTGSRFYQTPNLDRLAAEGMRFTDAYAACPVCSPTRASIMTGKYPARIHLTDWINGHNRPNAPLKIPDWTHYMKLEETTIAEALRQAGYATCHVGKWHLGDDPKYWPEHQGFDINKGGHSAGAPRGSGRYFVPYGNPRLADGPPGEYLTDREGAEAAAFVQQNVDRPFFLYMAHYAVHTPLMAKQDIKDKYAARPPATGHSNSTYAAMIHSMDQAVGRVLDTVRTLGIEKDTIVCFMSDNGGLLGPTNNRPLRGGKGQAYEGGIREPMIVKWPGVIEPGSSCSEPVISMDFYPTILHMAGLPPRPAQHLDGRSLVPLLRQRGSLDRDAIYWHYPHYHTANSHGPFGAVRAGRWKLIEFYENMNVELYDLAADLGENIDLAAALPARTDELRNKLHAWRTAVGARMPTPNI